MNKSVSHIKSVDDFNLIWNNRIDLCSTYFNQTLACSLALNFGFFGFLRSLYMDLTSCGLENSLTISTDHIAAYTNSALAKASYSEVNGELNDDIDELLSVLNLYENRKKVLTIDKLNNFILNYRYPLEQDGASIALPFSKEDICVMFFQDFYPSLRISLVSFLESKSLFSFNRKNTCTFMRKYEVNNEDISFINHSLSNMELSSANENTGLRIRSLVSELHSELSTLSNSYSVLLQDKVYLELKVKDLYDLFDLEKKQGINGYLRTWH